MEYFILKYTWKILYYYFGLCGIYPCKRIGPATLEQTSTCKFWITYCIANLVVNLAYQPVMCYIVFVESSLEELFNMLNTFIMPTNTTKFSFTTNLVIEIIIHIIGIVNIQKFAKRLVKIQNLVNDFAIFNIEDLKKNIKKSLLQFAFIIILMLTSIILLTTGNCYTFKSKLDLSLLTTILLLVTTFIQFLLFFAPIYYFVCVYLEVTQVFIHWCKALCSSENETSSRDIQGDPNQKFSLLCLNTSYMRQNVLIVCK